MPDIIVCACWEKENYFPQFGDLQNLGLANIFVHRIKKSLNIKLMRNYIVSHILIKIEVVMSEKKRKRDELDFSFSLFMTQYFLLYR